MLRVKNSSRTNPTIYVSGHFCMFAVQITVCIFSLKSLGLLTLHPPTVQDKVIKEMFFFTPSLIDLALRIKHRDTVQLLHDMLHGCEMRVQIDISLLRPCQPIYTVLSEWHANTVGHHGQKTGLNQAFYLSSFKIKFDFFCYKYFPFSNIYLLIFMLLVAYTLKSWY